MHPLQKDRQVYMSQYANQEALEKEVVMEHLGSAPSNESSICKIHLIEEKQHCGTPGFVPKWTGQHRPSTTPGYYTQCIKLIKSAFISIDNSKAMLGIQASTTSPFLL